MMEMDLVSEMSELSEISEIPEILLSSDDNEIPNSEMNNTTKDAVNLLKWEFPTLKMDLLCNRQPNKKKKNKVPDSSISPWDRDLRIMRSFFHDEIATRSPEMDSEEKERQDNNDPRWKEFTDLSTDAERKNLIKKKFVNEYEIDPTKSLAFMGYARNNMARVKGFPYRPELEMVDFNEFENDSEGLNEAIEKIRKHLNFTIIGGRIKTDKKSIDSLDTDPDSRKRKRESSEIYSDYRRQSPVCKKRKIRDIEVSLTKNYITTKRQHYPSKDLRYLETHFDAGLTEAREFLEYYNVDLGNLEEDSKEVEHHYNIYVQYYGKNYSGFCKDCDASHVF